jgi:BolA family transcriptional regulator, general stress-responsive regulator
MIEVMLKDILENFFDGDSVIVTNHSHLHHGHAGSPNSGQSHFHVQIISKKFTGLSRVKRHQLVNGHIKHLFDNGLHALSMNLSTPDEI